MYALKFKSSMTGNSFYICSDDEQQLSDMSWEVRTAFRRMVSAADDYSWGIFQGDYTAMLDDCGFTEISDCSEPVDEQSLYIIDCVEWRF